MVILKAVVCNKSFYSEVIKKQKFTEGKIYFVTKHQGDIYHFVKSDTGAADWYFVECFDDIKGDQKETVKVLYGKI